MTRALAAALLLLAAPLAAKKGDHAAATQAGENVHDAGKAAVPDTGDGHQNPEVIDVSAHTNSASVFERDAQGHVVGLRTTAGGGSGTGAAHGDATVSGGDAQALANLMITGSAQGLPNILLTPSGEVSQGPATSLPYVNAEDLGSASAPGAGSSRGSAGGGNGGNGSAAVTQRLEERAAQAEAGGEEGRASLLNAYAGRPETAERQATQALRNDASDKQALTALMVVRQRQGRGDEARDLARRALAADPDNALAKIVAGHADSLARGETLSKKLSKLDLGKTAETSGIGGALGLPGAFPAGGPDSPAGARDGAKTAGPAAVARPAPPMYDLTQPLTPAQELVVRAVRKHEIGDEQGAMLALTEAIDRDPKDAGAFVVRAEVDNSLLKYAEAVLDATRAVELAPTKPVLTARALRARAYANLELKQWVQALADASRAVDQDPQSGLGFLYRAMAEDKLGRGTAASDDITEAVKLDPALAPLAKPLLAKYGLQSSPSSAPARGRALLFGSLSVAAVLLAFGLRKLFVAQRLTTTAAKRLMESTPLP